MSVSQLWTPPKTWTPAETLSASDLNTYLGDNLRFLKDPPSCRLYRDTGLSLSTGSFTAIPWTQERWDNDGLHSVSTNPERVTIQEPGRYWLGAHVWFDFTGGNATALMFVVNGTREIARHLHGVASIHAQQLTIATEWSFSAGDYVEVHAFQDSGSTQSIGSFDAHSPEFIVSWRGGS